MSKLKGLRAISAKVVEKVAGVTAADIRSAARQSWVFSVAAAHPTAEYIAKLEIWQNLNSFKNEVSVAMDRKWIDYINGADLSKVMSASNHRILDGGHTFSESLKRAWAVGEEQGWSNVETFTEWSKAYLSDLSSSAGMPAFGEMTENMYLALKRLGISDEQARDLVTVNGADALNAMIGAAITTASLLFSWKEQDKANFSRAVGATLSSAAYQLNPITAAIAVASLAVGYQQKMITTESVIKGGVVAGASAVTCAIIPWFIPSIIGSIAVSSYISKSIKDDFFTAANLKEVAGSLELIVKGLDLKTLAKHLGKQSA